MRYALTDRQHHVPTSPLQLALILRATLLSAVELVPVAQHPNPNTHPHPSPSPKPHPHPHPHPRPHPDQVAPIPP
jgi:hypothetical protein